MEHKLILTFSYFVLFGTMSLVLLAVVVAEQDETERIVPDFIVCEAPGLNANRNCSSDLTLLTQYSNLATATYTLLGLFPVVILIFAINWKIASKRTKAFLIKHGWVHQSMTLERWSFQAILHYHLLQ